MSTTPNTPLGPFETEAQAFTAAEPLRERLRLAYNYPGPMTEETRAARHAVKVRHIADTLEAAGVELGAHDGHLVRWVARTWDPETLVVLLGWVERAHAAGRDALREEIRDLDTRTASLEAAAYFHALPPIDFPGRLAGHVPGPRCGAQDGRTALFMADVTCPACLEQINGAAAEPAACGRCAVPFDPTDTAFDGRARYSSTLFCHGCIDQCHEADAFHRCIICIGGGAR